MQELALNLPRCVLLRGEALDTVTRIVRDKSIDLVCTDPPYGEHTHANLGKERRKDGVKKREALTFPPLTHDQVLALCEQFVRVCKGWIVVFTDDRSVDWWGRGIEQAGGSWIRTGHWVKTNPMPQMTGDRPAVGTEPIVIAHAVGHKMVWNGGGRAATWRGPRDLDDLHPNQKPLWLMQELLGLFAPRGGTVLDPFLGSGSTGVAAMRADQISGLTTLEPTCKACNLKHVSRAPLPVDLSFLGIEGDEPTLQKAKERIYDTITKEAGNAQSLAS